VVTGEVILGGSFAGIRNILGGRSGSYEKALGADVQTLAVAEALLAKYGRVDACWGNFFKSNQILVHYQFTLS